MLLFLLFLVMSQLCLPARRVLYYLVRANRHLIRPGSRAVPPKVDEASEICECMPYTYLRCCAI